MNGKLAPDSRAAIVISSGGELLLSVGELVGPAIKVASLMEQATGGAPEIAGAIRGVSKLAEFDIQALIDRFKAYAQTEQGRNVVRGGIGAAAGGLASGILTRKRNYEDRDDYRSRKARNILGSSILGGLIGGVGLPAFQKSTAHAGLNDGKGYDIVESVSEGVRGAGREVRKLVTGEGAKDLSSSKGEPTIPQTSLPVGSERADEILGGGGGAAAAYLATARLGTPKDVRIDMINRQAAVHAARDAHRSAMKQAPSRHNNPMAPQPSHSSAATAAALRDAESSAKGLSKGIWRRRQLRGGIIGAATLGAGALADHFGIMRHLGIEPEPGDQLKAAPPQ